MVREPVATQARLLWAAVALLEAAWLAALAWLAWQG